MSPTQESTQETFLRSGEDGDQDFSEGFSNGGEMELEIVRVQLPLVEGDQGLESQVKFVVSEIGRLEKAGPTSIINYKRVWFKGELAEKWSGFCDSNCTGNLEGSGTFLCVEREKIGGRMSLEGWLEERRSYVLSEGQFLHIILELASAVKYLLEVGVSLDMASGLSKVLVMSENKHWSVSHFAPNSGFSLPVIKLSPSTFQFEGVLNGLVESSGSKIIGSTLKHPTEEKCSENGALQIFHKIVDQFLDFNDKHHNFSISPDVLNVIREFAGVKELSSDNLTSLITNLGEKQANGLIFNVNHPTKEFIGRENELKNLLQIISTTNNKLILIHGLSASGKTELVTQVASKIAYDKPTKFKTNILCFNCSSSDNLTASLYNLAMSKHLKVPLVDHMGGPRLIKDIFLEVISTFDETDMLILVFENADILTIETMDLIEIFKESKFISGYHHLVLIMREISNCPLLEDPSCVTLHLNSPSGTALKYDDKLFDKLEGHPQALEIITSYLECSESDDTSKIQDFSQFIDQSRIPPEIQDLGLRPIFLAYSYSLDKLTDKLDNLQKGMIRKILYVLKFLQDESPILVETLIDIVSELRVPSHQPDAAPKIDLSADLRTILSLMQKSSLLKITDDMIRLPYWTKMCIKFSLQLITSKSDKLSLSCCDIPSLISAYYLVLSSKSLEPDCWKLINHAGNLWRCASRADAEIAKRFDAMPDLIVKLAKSFKKLELITGFLKEAITIFSNAYSSSDIHVLKLKYLHAYESLLPKSQTYEASSIFKSIQEQCPLEPRDHLMLKLRSLIELGKIHLQNKEFEKAISCFQHVQILSVQKISILEVDSEPTVLTARLLHGQCHGDQGNLEESKKILLQVIPLLERYSGDDKDHVRILTLQGKYLLAQLLRKTGDLVNALMMQTKVLEDRDLLFGDKHPDTWASKTEMALLYSSYDNHSKSLQILRELLEIQETVLGAPSNRHSLSTMNSIAEIEAKLGNFDESLELYEAIDLIEQQVLPENDPMRISSQLSQAEVLISLGHYKEAIDTLNLIHTLLSSTSPISSPLLDSITSKREKCERSMEILGTYWLSLTPENVDSPGDITSLAKKHEVASQLAENLDNQGALRFLREVLEDLESGASLEPTNRFYLNVKADLARILGLVGKFNESFSVYKEIIPLMDKTFGETDELTMLCKDTMGQVFLFSGNQFLKRQMSNLKWFLV